MTMKKLGQTALVVLLCLGTLVGCGQSYDVDSSTVFVLKNGKVVSTDVESFDENTYDVDKLEAFVKEELDAYNSGNESGAVSMKSLKAEDGKAALMLEYGQVNDYTKFNGIELFAGSVAEALNAGYSFDTEFAEIKDGKANSCDVRDILAKADYKVVIYKGTANVCVPGKIVYASSANVSYVDEHTVAIKEGTDLLGQNTEAVTENTEASTETVMETEGTQAPEDMEGAVSDDDLLADDEETSEVVFDFPEEPSGDDTLVNEFSQTYTYIIYK